jgi:hypothetical protein
MDVLAAIEARQYGPPRDLQSEASRLVQLLDGGKVGFSSLSGET